MKRNFTPVRLSCLLLLIGLAGSTRGQNYGPTYKSESDNILAPLNKAFMQTRTLYDRVGPIANLYRYDGSNEAPTSNSDHFHQAIWEVYNATYDLNGQHLPDPNQVASDLSAGYNAYNHPIAILCHQYEFLDSLAVQKNLITVQNGQLYDVPNRTASPYIPATVIMAAPLASPEGYVAAGTHYFEVSSNFFIGNQTSQIDHFDINLDDGQGWHTVYTRDLIYSAPAINSPHSPAGNPRWAVTLTAGSTKTITVRITFMNGQVKQALATIKAGPSIATPVGGCDGNEQIAITGLPFSSYEYDGNSSVRSALGRAYIYFADAHCQNQQVRKPIIFLDGFDPSNSRDVNKIYNDYIDQPFDQSGQTVKLANELRQRGYDIIIYDYLSSGSGTGGADFIEANALSVVRLIQELYSRYGSMMEEDFVIIGPSMGSAVAQYALAYMEHNNMPHHTRLFASFDGIHQGANIPIGIQRMVNYIAQRGLVSALLPSLSKGLHNTNAARQMLIHHAETDSETPKASRYRDVFLQHLQQVGNYPQQCRNIAVINGNNQGTANQNINPCQSLLHVQVKRTGLGAFFCSGLNCNLIDWTAYSSAQTGPCLALRMWTTRLNGILLDLPKLIEDNSRPAPGNISYDRVPGSSFGPLIKDEDRNGFNKTVDLVLNLLFPYREHNLDIDAVGQVSFVPSTSAADLRTSTNPTFRLADVTLTKCSGATPFDRVYAPDISSKHVEINAVNADWFRGEIYNHLTTTCNPNSCDFTVSANNLNVTCNQQGVQLTATCSGADCNNVSYSWSGNGLNQSGQTISFTPPNIDGSFIYTVTASRAGCSNKTANATVNVSACSTSGGSLSVGCYVIKSQKTGQSLQAMVDGSIKQQGGNGQSNQVWKAEDAGNSQFRFTTQNGSDQVIKANSGTGNGEQLSLGSYTGDDRQKWAVQKDNGTGSYRVYRSNGITWDLNNYANNPELQLWGTTAEPFYDYRQFRFEATGCSGGGGGTAVPTQGYLDYANCSSIGGWAFATTNGGQATNVDIYINGNKVATIPSTTAARNDVKQAYAGQYPNIPVNCGFSWDIPAPYKNGSTLTFSVRPANAGTDVSASPKIVNSCSGGRMGAIQPPEETKDLSLLVYPNPASGRFTTRFYGASGQAVHLQVSDLLGRLLYNKTVQGAGNYQDESIELPTATIGLVIVDVHCLDQHQSQLVVIQK